MMKIAAVTILLIIASPFIYGQQTTFLEQAHLAIEEFEQHCKSEAWNIWQESLCGPLSVVNKHRTLLSNEPVPGAESYKQYFKSSLPASFPIANTAYQWHNKRRIMLIYPLPASELDRLKLMAHEAFHRIQPDLGLITTEATNAHLQSAGAKYWLFLELRALQKAYLNRDDQALVDAWTFRQKRYQEFPVAKVTEQAHEFNEGLAEYTGLKAVQDVDYLRAWFRQLGDFEKRASIERVFGYFTGPAWLFNFETHQINWKDKVNSEFSLASVWSPPTDELTMPLSEREDRYQGQSLYAKLHLQEQRIKDTIKAIKKDYLSVNTWTIPLNNMSMGFDPNGTTSIPGLGTHYKPLEVSDRWGKLESASGGIISKDYRSLTLHCDQELVEANSSIKCGENWTIAINQGWQIDQTQNRIIKRETL